MDRTAYLLSQKQHGRPVIGVFPAQYPKEILWAFGLVPAEIWDPKLRTTEAGQHLQPYTCSVARLGLELVLQGKCDFVSGFLFPHTCDSIQNLGSMIHDFVRPEVPCHFFYHPKAPYGPHSNTYYMEQLRKLVLELGRFYGPLDRDNLHSALVSSNRVRKAQLELRELRAKSRLPVSNVEYYRVLRLGEFLLPEDYLRELEVLKLQASDSAKGLKKVVVSGVLPNPEGLLEILDGIGLHIAADDFLSIGRRWSPFLDTSLEDPFESLAKSYFSMPPCSTKGSSVEDRLAHQVELVEVTGAKAVIFWITKFCETELFDVPFLMKELKDRGIEGLSVETELHQSTFGQLVTRLEAFSELLA
ncbi:MAG: 2-hydroxyacyl-CoA dehydratase [Deltaproteobacteria bacterium]|nr:2-hydroxyacyl-CoA dehydratase [Deltaproteobacteria bacterium]